MFKRFYHDDLTHLVAMVAIIGCAACIEQYVKLVIQELQIEGKTHYPPEWMIIRAHKWQAAFSICFMVSLWFVKLSFLLFYRLLFEASVAFRKAWWVVMIFTLVTFWAPFAGLLTSCGPTSNMWITSKSYGLSNQWSALCLSLLMSGDCAKHRKDSENMIIYCGVLHIVTDLLSEYAFYAVSTSKAQSQ